MEFGNERRMDDYLTKISTCTRKYERLQDIIMTHLRPLAALCTAHGDG